MVARHQPISRSGEQDLFSGRFLSIQPTLDQTSYKLWGQFPGIDGQLIEQALTTRADQYPPLPNGRRCTRTQRQADALVSIAQDSLDQTPTANPHVSPVGVDLPRRPPSRYL